MGHRQQERKKEDREAWYRAKYGLVVNLRKALQEGKAIAQLYDWIKEGHLYTCTILVALLMK
jgi:hypothetical protein